MKTTVKSASFGFQPITLEVVIESRKELASMWAALNASSSTLFSNAAGRDHIQALVSMVCNSSLFKALDLLAITNNLKEKL
jgi:hypothetical protein